MNPINYLQEYCQQNNMQFPKYDFIDHKILPNSNIFTMRVAIESLKTEGTASNKKAAKFKAAEKMISLLKEQHGINSKFASNSSSPYCSPEKSLFNNTNTLSTSLNADSLNHSSSTVDSNFVGILQEFCVKRQLKIPIYDWDSRYVGTGHKLICRVGEISEEAVASNKKIAKQACAEKVWQRLMKLDANIKNNYDRQDFNETNSGNKNVELLSFSLDNLKIHDTLNLKSSTEKANLLFSKIHTGSVSDPKDIFLNDYHSYLKKSLTPDTLKKVNQYLSGLTLNVDRGMKLLEKNLMDLCSLLNVDCREINLKSTIPNQFLVAYTMNTIPSCTEIGTGNCYIVAKMNAIIYSIKAIREILQ